MGLTRQGVAVLVSCAALLAVGWWLGYREAALIGVSGAVSVLGALLWVVPGLKLVVQRVAQPTRVGRGQPAYAELSVRNLGRRRRISLTARDRCAGGIISVALPAIRAGSQESVRYLLPTERRGLVQIGPLRVDRVDPLGLARRVHRTDLPITLLVRPRARDLGAFPAGLAGNPEGSTSDATVGSSVVFHSLREFELGDDVRRVHWPSTARTGTLMVSQQADVSRPNLALLLDCRVSSYVDADGFELAVEVAASIGLTATRRGIPVQMRTTAGATVDTQEAAVLLDWLASVHTDTAATLSAGLKPARGQLIVVTGADAPGDEDQIGSLRDRFDQILLVCAGSGRPLERPRGAVRRIVVSDLESLADQWRLR